MNKNFQYISRVTWALHVIIDNSKFINKYTSLKTSSCCCFASAESSGRLRSGRGAQGKSAHQTLNLGG